MLHSTHVHIQPEFQPFSLSISGSEYSAEDKTKMTTLPNIRIPKREGVVQGR